jgi:hypothetical protein
VTSDLAGTKVALAIDHRQTPELLAWLREREPESVTLLERLVVAESPSLDAAAQRGRTPPAQRTPRHAPSSSRSSTTPNRSARSSIGSFAVESGSEAVSEDIANDFRPGTDIYAEIADALGCSRGNTQRARWMLRNPPGRKRYPSRRGSLISGNPDGSRKPR